MYSYDKPLRVTYSFPAQNFTSPITRHIKPPTGCVRGNISSIQTSVTTTFTQTTTPGHFKVGDGTTDDKYADLNMGAAAANTSYGDGDVAGTIKSNAGSTIDFDRDGNSDIVVKTVAPTGGTPAGVADVYLTIDWF
jgi:hypothetical protein